MRGLPAGVKGLAEITIRGVVPSIANGVSHATAIRVREVPILPERLLCTGEVPGPRRALRGVV